MTMKTMFRLATGCIISAALTLTGCGGGGGGGGGGAVPAVSTVVGTASEGALILGKTVKLKDATGKSAPDATTDATTGSYTVNVTGLTAPYLLTVTGTNGTYVSLAPAAGTANINPITTTVVALASGTSDPSALFANLKAADVVTISANYAAKTTAVTTALATVLPTGVTASDYFTGTIAAGKGIDSLFDSYKITVAPGTGITVTTKDASATTVMSVPTVSSATELPAVTKASLITLSVDKSSTIASQNITITADVKIAGNAAPDNTVVNFSTDAGTLSAATATTSGGKASVTITASAVTNATVSASVPATVLLAPVRVSFTAVPTYAITLTPDVSSQVVGKSITITANITLGGTAATDGTVITFAAVGGQLSGTSAAITSGKASVTITSGATGLATVTASAGAGALNAGSSDPLALTFTAAPTPVVTLSSDTSTAMVGQNITLTANVTLSGAAVANGTSVTFASTGGTLAANAATTVNGKASVTITASAAGSASVTATSGGIASNAVALTFSAPVVYTQAVLKLKTTGTLPSGSKIGAWGVTMQFPASGLSIKTKSTTTTALDKTAFFQSGVADPATFSFTYSGTFNVADGTSTLPYLLLASLGDVTDATNGMSSVGEIATIVFDIASGAATPTKSSFILSNKSVASTAAGGVKLTTVDLDFDLTLR